MQSDVFEAFRAIDIPEDKAMKAAAAVSKRDDDVVSVKGELLLIKSMMGFVLAFQVAFSPSCSCTDPVFFRDAY
jgi:hypothetical protein